MNSIRRPRKRPRVRSVNFRVFGWLLVREAYLRIRFPQRGEWGNTWIRHDLVDSPTHVLRRRAERILRLNESRRYYP